MLGAAQIVVTLSSYSQTVEPNSSSITVTARLNGAAITDGTSSMLTYDGSVVTSCTISSSGVITMRYGSNTSISSTKSGWMKFTYQGQTKQFNLTQKADYVTNTSATTSSETKTYVNSISNVSSLLRNCQINGYYATVKFSGGGYTQTKSRVTTRTYYKSGNVSVQTSDEKTTTASTSFSNSYIYFNQATMNINIGQTSSQSFYTDDRNYPAYYKRLNNGSLSLTVTVNSKVDDNIHDGCYNYYNASISWSHNGVSGTNSSGHYGTECCWD